jgi:hypothetical protein
VPLTLRLATAADDADIRRLLAAHPVPGRITVTLEREPDYFLGCSTMGPFCQVVVGRDDATGELVGVACRAVRRLWVNGEARDVGYLSQLRVHASYRGRWLVSRGFRFFRALHADGRVTRYLTTITEDNHDAQGVLVEHARPHFPRYREVDRLATLTLLLRRGATRTSAGDGLEHVTAPDPAEVAGFLERQGPEKQFFPVYTKDDLQRSPTTRGLRAEDLLAVARDGRLVGVAGLWDQLDYKQTVVRDYAGALGWARPLCDAAAQVLGVSPLTPPGAIVRAAYLAFPCVAGNDPAVFRVLLARACAEAARRGYAWLLVGLVARDPLLAVAQRRFHVTYWSRLYMVAFEEEERRDEPLDGRLPYVEIAAL